MKLSIKKNKIRNLKKTKKNKNNNKQKKQKKTIRYKGGFIVPPPKIQSTFSITNPTVSVEDSGSPYQRVNTQLQANNQKQADLNKTLNGQAPKTTGGKKNIKKNKKKNKEKGIHN